MSRVPTKPHNPLKSGTTIQDNENAKFKIFILNLLSLGGFSVALFLSHHFYQVRNGTSGFKSFCNIAGQMNCDVVAASPYAELFRGLPISSLGAGWYLGLFLISVVAHNVFWRREAIRACFIMTAFAALTSIPYFLIMALTLKTFCLLCLVLDGIALASLFTVLILKPERFSKHKLDLSKWKIFLLIVAGSLFAAVLGCKSMDTGTLTHSETKEYLNSILNSSPVAVKTNPDFPSIGPANAPITIVEFSDFQCPFCRIGAYAVHSAMNSHPGQVRIEFRNFPLDQACNPEVHQSAHPVACEAARVAMCAHKQGKFEAVHDELFDKQATFAPGRPLKLAEEMGLNGPALEACVSAPEAAQIVNRDVLEAVSLGIKSTPTFFVNGYRVEGAYPVPVWNMLFDHLLSK
ncbi:MAG: thioredoxin domain-containing protein [Bdellovibrionia bacterium]